ncbi:MAG: T9SS type A sorting domain-containing protein [Chitinophagales bacterium]
MHRNTYILICTALLITLNISSVLAQDIGPYVYPYESGKLSISKFESLEEKKALLGSLFSNQVYEGVNFNETYVRNSAGGVHYTFQVDLNHIPMEQVFVKIHCDHAGNIRLVQSNLPNPEAWRTINIERGEIQKNSVYVYREDRFALARKEYIQEEKNDAYYDRYWLNNHDYYQNNLKFHNDTTAYAKVFKPDPLSSASMVYGGNYQDAFRFDTSALVIQNINNPGGTTITTNSATYNYGGVSFNVPAESYLNDFTDPIIRQVFTNIFLNGQGVVIGFNTAITDNVAAFITEIVMDDYNYPALAQEQFWGEIPVDYAGGKFNLSNNFFVIRDLSPPFTNPSTSPTDSFNFNRSEVDFEDVNAFYHLNRFQAYWESLGFADLALEVILVDAHGNNGADNSFFAPTSPPRLIFGQGGVDDAEDADVIIHEYGHAISAFASPESNVAEERRALDEGFGDYLATSYSKQFTNFASNEVFTWDGHNEFWLGRISNSNKTKLDISINQNIYFNGEVWSATLNDLHNNLGATISDKLAIEVMYYNMPNTTISQAAKNLFLADTLLYGGIHTCEIFDILFMRKFLLGTCLDFYSGLQNQFSQDNRVQLLNTHGFTNYGEDILVRFETEEYRNSQIKLFDIKGECLFSYNLKAQVTQLNFPKLSAGAYFMTLTSESNSYRFKLLKK